MDLKLRPATPGDRASMECTYFETQRWIIERLFGWRGQETEEAKFAEFYDEANSSIIIFEGIEVGWLTLVRAAAAYELEGIYIDRPHQRKGLGTRLIQLMVTEANDAGLSLRLSTAKINPALKLYERLRFHMVREDEFKVYMEIAPRQRTGDR